LAECVWKCPPAQQGHNRSAAPTTGRQIPPESFRKSIKKYQPKIVLPEKRADEYGLPSTAARRIKCYRKLQLSKGSRRFSGGKTAQYK
jgi:hypothetical protein